MIKNIATLMVLFTIIFLSISQWLAENKKISYRDVDQKIEILRSSVLDYQYARIMNLPDAQKEYNRVKFDYKQVQTFIDLFKKESKDKYAFNYRNTLEYYLNDYNYQALKLKAWIKESVTTEQINIELFSRKYKVKWYEDISEKIYIILKLNQKSNNTAIAKVSYSKEEMIVDTASDSLPSVSNKYLNSNIIPLHAQWYKVIEVDKESFNWEYTIAINKFVSSINNEDRYSITHWMYIQKWSHYFLISGSRYSRYPNSDRFSFNSYDVKSFFDRKYREENGDQDRYDYSRNDDRKNVLREKIYAHLDNSFHKYKAKRTSKQYVNFLTTVQKKVVLFKKTEKFNEQDYEDITTLEKEKAAYKIFKRNKNKLKIVEFLTSYLSDEIYKNTLDDTLSDFLPKWE